MNVTRSCDTGFQPAHGVLEGEWFWNPDLWTPNAPSTGWKVRVTFEHRANAVPRDPAQLPPDASDADASLPPGLLADLAALYPAPRVPAVVDARVLNDAAATYARQARHRRRLRWAGAGAAAAAAVLIVGLILPHRGGMTPQPRYSLRGDLDGNGRVDILDAFALARELRDANGKPLRADQLYDINGDGVIDQKDVDLLARMAVQVEGSPSAAGTSGS